MSSAGWTIKAGSYVAEFVVDDDVAARLRSMLSDLDASGAIGHVGRIEVLKDGRAGYIIRSDGRVWDDAVAEPDVPDEVVHMLLRASLDEERLLVHIHAGAVVLGPQTAVVAGWSGSGKSTAITTLIGSGFSYVSDERLTVSLDGRSIIGFPKPISLIAGSFGALEHLDPDNTGFGARNSAAWQIPASSIGTIAPQGWHSPTILVFVSYRPGAELRVDSVPLREAAARLLIDSPDVVVRGRDGASSIVALASSIPCIDIEYSDSEDLVAVMRELLDHPPDSREGQPIALAGRACEDRPVPGSPEAMDVTGPYAVAEGCTVWIFEAGAIAYVHGQGTVAELDSTSAVWLQLIDEGDSLQDLIVEVAAATGTDAAMVRSTAQQTLHGLWSAGIVGPTTSA
jgi:hypothetical protein